MSRASLSRRDLLRTAGTTPVSVLLGTGAAESTPDRTATMVASALPGDEGTAGFLRFRPADFGIVGVFDVDWLLQPRFTRLLDSMAASPGAFSGVRFFGALNSGELENVFPQSSGGVWRDPATA